MRAKNAKRPMVRRRVKEPILCHVEDCGAFIPNPCKINLSVEFCQADARKLMFGTHDVILHLRERAASPTVGRAPEIGGA